MRLAHEARRKKRREEAMALSLTDDEAEFLKKARWGVHHAEQKLKALIYHIIENNKETLIDDLGIPKWDAYTRYMFRAYLLYKEERDRDK